MFEVWRDIKGFEGYYQVSNYGRVRSLTRVKFNGNGYFIYQGKEKVPICNKGYYQVKIYKNGKCKTIYIHRLVAEAFIPNPYNYPCVNHRDENPKNNFVWVNDDGSVDLSKSNLEWCTIAYNNAYNGLHSRRGRNK